MNGDIISTFNRFFFRDQHTRKSISFCINVATRTSGIGECDKRGMCGKFNSSIKRFR